jgi:hypothetical protein
MDNSTDYLTNLGTDIKGSYTGKKEEVTQELDYSPANFCFKTETSQSFVEFNSRTSIEVTISSMSTTASLSIWFYRRAGETASD